MLHALFSTLPTTVCLCWFVIFALCFHKADKAKRILTGFLGVCTILYLCHAYFFNDGEQSWVEGLWIMCSLSVYPIYFIYIKQLTSSESAIANSLLYLLPAPMVAMYYWMGYYDEALITHKIVFLVQVLLVFCFGARRLTKFDHELKEAYADTEETSTESLCFLLYCFVLTSFISAVFNSIGRQFFADSDWLLAIPSILFSTMLFAISYVGYTQKYAALQLSRDTETEEEELEIAEEGMQATDRIGPVLQQLMEEKKLYLQPNIKVGDLAIQVGTCRTYLSAYINKELGISFSDFINSQRISYACELKKQNPELSTSELAQKSGFASESSFTRNYKRFSQLLQE